MRTVLLTGLLLVSAGGPALADDLSSRFSDDFGGGAPPARTAPAAPARPAAAAPAAAPVATAAPDATDPALIAPKPRRRPVRSPAGGGADADVSAFVAQPASRPGNPPPAPAVKAIKAEAPIAGSGYQVGISWNALDPGWDGMFVTNNSGGSLSLAGAELNNRSECQLKPYSLDKIKQVFGLQQAVKAWGKTAAINLIGLPKTGTGSVLAPELPRNMQDLGLASEEATLKAGDRIPIVNATKCSPVVEAKVATDGGAVSIRFKRPYSGH